MITAFTTAKRFGGRAVVALTMVAFALVGGGCGPWEPEPQTAASYRVPPPEPRPATSEELSVQAAAREQAAWDGEGEVAVGASADEYVDTDPSALTDFKPVLAPYGTWVDDGTYGTVWVPREDVVGRDFQPYMTAGRWTYSDEASWVWVSDYEWGWAPFHYGRWVSLPQRGWAWIPGRQYAGAWVTWRTGPVGYEYLGWAPMAPSWYWMNGVAVGWSFGWYSPRYVYCPHAYIYHPGFHPYVVRSGPSYATIHERTRPYTPPADQGRVVATPGVSGGGRVIAEPAVGGRTVATPQVGGPRPTELGMKSPIASPPEGHAGLAKAEAYATPRSAIAQGGSAPVTMQTRPRSTDGQLGNPAPGPSGVASGSMGSRSALSSRPSSSYDPVARAPQVQGVVPTPSRPLPEYRSRSMGTDAYAAPQPSRSYGSYGSASPVPSYRSSPPSYGGRSGSSWGSSSPTPSYRSSSPSVSAPSRSYSSPSVSSRPSYRSSPSPSRSYSSPSVSSRPSYRPSSPSVSAPSRSYSTPSVRSAPSAPRSSGGTVRGSTSTRGKR